MRTDLTLDGTTGAILTRKDFGDRKLVDRIVGYGIAVHEGQLFGWVNQLLNLLTAIGLTLLAISSVVLWWRRRPEGVLGAPSVRSAKQTTTAFGAALILLGLLLPLFGVSLILVLIGDLGIRRYSARWSNWLGLVP